MHLFYTPEIKGDTHVLDEQESEEEGQEPTARLMVEHRRLDDFRLTSGEEDEFTGGGLSFSFERDRNGQVIGFYVANGRTRDVRFERVR